MPFTYLSISLGIGETDFEARRGHQSSSTGSHIQDDTLLAVSLVQSRLFYEPKPMPGPHQLGQHFAQGPCYGQVARCTGMAESKLRMLTLSQVL